MTVDAGPPPAPASFAPRLLRWQRAEGRHGLPWQGTRDPYRVWLSEIMLQQTQVAAVVPYYERFLARFPDVAALAAAPVDEVMRHWAGLGYYSRARNLHAAARMVVERFDGAFPTSAARLAELPGVGRSTAAAIAAFAFGERAAILDGNVKRVLARAFGVEGFPGAPTVERALWSLAESLLPSAALAESDPDAMASYTQGLMDLGATVCVRARPRCPRCPFAVDCVARVEGRVDALPAARPRKAVPRRATAMLVIRDGDRVLVEKRPDIGVWGGLWSLPELAAPWALAPDPAGPADPPDPADDGAAAVDVEAAIAAEVASRFGLRARAASRLSPFEHAFTHYRLTVQPWLVEVEVVRAASPLAAPGWLAPGEVATAALPQPVKRLLAALAEPRLL